jgi:hypothetical protein
MQKFNLAAAVALACSLFASGANADAPAVDRTTTPENNPGSAVPLDAATTNDLRCAIVYMQMISSQDTKINTAGYIGLMYWMGRLDGRAPNLDLENRIMAELPEMTPDVIRAEAQRCGAEMQVRGKALTEIGNDLVQRGEKRNSRTKEVLIGSSSQLR